MFPVRSVNINVNNINNNNNIMRIYGLNIA